MISKNDLPQNYKPYQFMHICSNQLINCRFLITIGNNIPLLIGTSTKPLIWLSAIIDIKKKHYIDLIVASEVIHPTVSIFENEKNIFIKVKDQLIMSLYSKDEELIVISQIDLRPIGLNVYGDENALHIVNNELSSNSFQNLETMIGFSES